MQCQGRLFSSGIVLEHDLSGKAARPSDHAEAQTIPGSCGDEEISRPRRNLTAEFANRLFNETKQSLGLAQSLIFARLAAVQAPTFFAPDE
jgi:hypothetical protein